MELSRRRMLEDADESVDTRDDEPPPLASCALE